MSRKKQDAEKSATKDPEEGMTQLGRVIMILLENHPLILPPSPSSCREKGRVDWSFPAKSNLVAG